MKRRWLVAAAVGGLLAATAAGTGVAAWRLGPDWAERELRHALEESEEWDGEFGSLDIDLWARRIVIEDLDVQATINRKVLREIQIPRAVYTFAWSDLLAGRLHLQGVALGPVVRAGYMEGREPKKNHPMPDPGFFRFQVDTTIVDGSWSWIHESGARHDVVDANGIYNGLGSVDGPGHLWVFGRAGSHGSVVADGALDFLNAHRDAIDLALQVRGFDAEALQGMEANYLQSRMLEGVIDADIALTLDRGRVELEAPYRTGRVDDLDVGRVVGWVCARGLSWGGLPIDPVEAGHFRAVFEGPLRTSEQSWIADVLARDVRVSLRRSQLDSFGSSGPAAGSATPGEILASLPRMSIPSARLQDVRLSFVDDQQQPAATLSTRPLQVELLGLDNYSGKPAAVGMHGEVLEGALRVDGTLDLSAWPPRTDLEATLRQGRAEALVEVLRPYLPEGRASGLLDATGRLVVDESGAIEPTARLHTEAIEVGIGPWSGTLQRGDISFFRGDAVLAGLTIENGAPTSVFDRGEAQAAKVHWDALRLFDDQQVVADVTLSEPVLHLRRPGPSDGEGGPLVKPKQDFSLDVHASDGTLVWTDPQVGSELRLSPFQADIVGLGTMTKRAHWTVSGDLERGGHLQGWADVDAFAGPGADLELDAHATLEGLDLSRFATEAKGYADLTEVAGEADLLVDMDSEALVFEAEGRNLRLAHTLLSASAERGRAKVTMADGEPLAIEGNLVRAIAHVRTQQQGELDAGGDDALSVRLDALDLADSTVIFETERGQLPLQETWMRVRDLSWPIEVGRGRADLSARLLGGELVGTIEPQPDHHHLDLVGRGMRLTRTNPWLSQVASIDLDQGRGSARITLDRGADGRIQGEVRARVHGLDVFQTDDFDDGFMAGLREAAIGTVLHLADRKDTLELVLPVDTALEKPVDPVGAVKKALGRRFGFQHRDDEAWAEFDQVIAAEAVSDLQDAIEAWDRSEAGRVVGDPLCDPTEQAR